MKVTHDDGLVKSQNSIKFVIPAEAGIQLFQDVLDPGFRRGDDPKVFFETINGKGRSLHPARQMRMNFRGNFWRDRAPVGVISTKLPT